jgi:hypothetical protein
MLPLLLSATAAAATAIPVNAPPDVEVSPRLRSGVVVGFTLGAGLAGASGYPNSSSLIGNPTYYSASGFMTGPSGQIFVMGALADYLSFGFWFGSASFGNGDWKSGGGAGGLRVEAFPLVGVLPVLANLGVQADFGIGSGNLQSRNPARPEASGTQSYIGAGAFYEWAFGKLFGGHFAIGPSVEYDAMWSQPFERHGLVASVRFVFYGGP